MQRDIGNEFVVALFALAALIFALLFAVLLAISTRSLPAPTSTPVATGLPSATAIAVTITVEPPTTTAAETQPPMTIAPIASDLPPATETLSTTSPEIISSASAFPSESATPVATAAGATETPVDIRAISTAEKRTALAKTATEDASAATAFSTRKPNEIENPTQVTPEIDSETILPTDSPDEKSVSRDGTTTVVPVSSIGPTDVDLKVDQPATDTLVATEPAATRGTAAPIRRTPVVKLLATEIETVATSSKMPTQTDEAVTTLVKHTATATPTASPTKTEVPLSTETDEFSGTATSVEREIRASRTALVKSAPRLQPLAAAATDDGSSEPHRN